MRISPLKIVIGLFLCICLTGLVQAEERFTTSRLRAAGADPNTLQPITFNHDDTVLAAFDRAPFEEKKEGVFYRLWFFEVERDGRFGEVHRVDLPLTNFQQGEFTPDDEKFVVVGQRGTTFLAVDMNSFQISPLYDPEWGKEGFRADPAVLWTEAGKLFAVGHFYDKARFIESRTIATVRPHSKAGSIFERGPNIAKVEQDLERLWMTNYVTDKKAYYGQKYPSTTILSLWDGETVREFDRAPRFLGFWGNAGRLLYSTRRGEQQPCELTLYDSNSQSKTVLAESEDSYRYLFLSRDGQTVLTSQISETAGRLVPYFAKEYDDWQLKPLVTDRDGNARTLGVGWMRLASEGKFVAHVGETGLTLYPLEY